MDHREEGVLELETVNMLGRRCLRGPSASASASATLLVATLAVAGEVAADEGAATDSPAEDRGEIQVQSEPGRGTTIAIVLPQVTPEGAAGRSHPS